MKKYHCCGFPLTYCSELVSRRLADYISACFLFIFILNLPANCVTFNFYFYITLCIRRFVFKLAILFIWQIPTLGLPFC